MSAEGSGKTAGERPINMELRHKHESKTSSHGRFSANEESTLMSLNKFVFRKKGKLVVFILK